MSDRFPGWASALFGAVVVSAGVLGACSSERSAEETPSSVSPAGQEAGTTTKGDGATTPKRDPFAAQPDESEGLVNISPNLDALLEHGALEGACARYKGGATDRKTMLLCGKWMYFHETFGTMGVPSAIIKFLAQNFPGELGLGFSKLGMVPDPRSADHLPLGLAPTAPINGNEALAFTCASCHFAQLPDGRYAVGAPNHRYDYGKHILAIGLAPALGMGLGKEADHDPTAVARVRPVLDKLKDLKLKAKFGLALLPLASSQGLSLGKDVERGYATWPNGTLDFLIAPLPVDDGVEIVSKMIGLWGIPRPEEITAAGMPNAMLAFSGDAHSLEIFLQGFAVFGGVPLPDEATLKPLVEYIYSLRAPENPNPPPQTEVEKGEVLFTSKGCAECHGGPRGSGIRVYTFDEIGTDRALARWVDPDLDFKACCNLDMDEKILTHGIKSPRLVGTWALGRFLHNGSLSSLDELFCLQPRPPVGTEPMRTDGHSFTCDGLSDDEKRSLQAYLLAH